MTTARTISRVLARWHMGLRLNHVMIQYNESYHTRPTELAMVTASISTSMSPTPSSSTTMPMTTTARASWSMPTGQANSGNVCATTSARMTRGSSAVMAASLSAGTVSNTDVYGNTVYVSSAASDPAAMRVITYGGTPTNLRCAQQHLLCLPRHPRDGEAARFHRTSRATVSGQQLL